MGQGPCPCKYRLGLGGKDAPATVVVTDPNGNESSFTGTINFSAVQCFTGAAMCNPAVNNFKLTFEDKSTHPATTINFTKGRRGTISCVDNTVAFLSNGTAQASGNLLDGSFTVDFSYSINTITNVATVAFMAAGGDNTTFQTTFTAPVSPQTFIGNCDETVGP